MRKNKIVTVLLLLLTPIVSFCLMEGITGNLLTISRSGILLDLVISYFILGMCMLLFKKMNTAAMVQMLLLIVLGLTQYYVYGFRGRSFMLTDLRLLRTAAAVAWTYSFLPERRVLLCLTAVVIWLILLRKSYTIKVKKYRMIRLVCAVACCVGAISCLFDTEFVKKHNSLALDMWDIDASYQNKGVLLMLASEVPYLTVEKPENYSTEKVKTLAEEYGTQYDNKVSNTKDTENIKPDNLIVIMNESFADMRVFEAFEEELSVLETFDTLESEHGSVYKGYLSVPVFGGFTANTEYEVLTGNRLAFWNTWSVAYQVYSQEKEYSMASILKQQGYDTLAMHPENPLNYNRTAVYRSMDFNDFISVNEWDDNYKEIVRWWINDVSSYSYMKKIIESKDAEKLFTFLLTMQNHATYQTDGYEHTVTLELEQEYPEAEEYLSSLKNADETFGDLIASYQNADETTMIVMFGDHMPNLTDGFYEELERNSALSSEEFYRREYLTPYVIWTNYELQAEEIPLMSANFLGSYILECAGAELSDYNKMILEVLDEIAVINPTEIMTADGTWIAMEDLSEEQKKLLNDYESMQYNEVFGRSKRVEMAFQAS